MLSGTNLLLGVRLCEKLSFYQAQQTPDPNLSNRLFGKAELSFVPLDFLGMRMQQYNDIFQTLKHFKIQYCAH